MPVSAKTLSLRKPSKARLDIGKTPLDFNSVRLVPLARRPSKIRLDLLGREPKRGASFRNFWQGLPDILAVRDLRLLVERLAQARRKKHPVLLMFGAHVIKTGLSRYLISLMEREWVTALACNGAGVIHDFEIAYAGRTSEDVAVALKNGTFGFARETAEYLNAWAKEAASSGEGLGRAIGRRISESQFPNKSLSLFARAWELGVPISVHAAIGTDIIYQHPSCDGAAWGGASFQDFRRLAEIVRDLGSGGVVMNFGSAVLMPEVFLKALAINKNLGVRFPNLTTANFDMILHYRARVNILERPTQETSRRSAFNFTGHHEILLPLLAQALVESG